MISDILIGDPSVKHVKCLPFFSVSDADGQMKVTEVATRPLVQDLLNHDVSLCFIQQTNDVSFIIMD